jgi:3-hydroxybutyryl-CoA dehydratase
MLMESNWNAYIEGAKFTWSFSISREDMRLFGDLVNDHNPIHEDEYFSKAKGFFAPVVYGVLLAGQVSKLVGTQLPDKHAILTGFCIDFIKPAYQHDNLEFSALLKTKSESTKSLDFSFIIRRSVDIISKGTVNAVWHP